MAAQPTAAKPARRNDVEPNVEDRQRLAANPSHPSSVARAALRRQIPKVGAECLNWARSVLCGGLAAMRVPTAISRASLINVLMKGFSWWHLQVAERMRAVAWHRRWHRG